VHVSKTKMRTVYQAEKHRRKTFQSGHAPSSCSSILAESECTRSEAREKWCHAGLKPINACIVGLSFGFTQRLDELGVEDFFSLSAYLPSFAYAPNMPSEPVAGPTGTYSGSRTRLEFSHVLEDSSFWRDVRIGAQPVIIVIHDPT
jgi:hypothetical protein